MKTKYKKELKTSDDLVIGDTIKIGGLVYDIVKLEDIFHYVPNARIRVALRLVGGTPKISDAVLFLPRGIPITTLK